jgi:phage terminase large subunit
MREKGYRYGKHYAPHDIEVRDVSSGEKKALTRKEVAEALGINYEVVPKVPIDDGISAVRIRFSTLWIDKTKCALLLKALRNYQKEFDEKRGRFKNSPLHNWASHGADMLRYWGVTIWQPITKHQQDDVNRIRQNKGTGE